MRMIIAIAIVFLSSVPPAVSQVPLEKLIVPGERLGRWVLPTTIDSLLQMNGRRTAIGGGQVVAQLPYADQQPTQMWVHRWDSLGFRALTIGLRDTQEVFNFTIGVGFSPMAMNEIKTERDVGLTVSREVVETAYGKPTAITQATPELSHLIYDELGLALGILEGRVATVIVFRKGTAKQRWRF